LENVVTQLDNQVFPDLLDVTQALHRLLDHFAPLEVVETQLSKVAGYVLGEDVLAQGDFPPFNNSAMDGFAVRSDDVSDANPENPISLHVVADIPAGWSVDLNLKPGQAARIMTGAVVPQGADAVVPVEDTDFNLRRAGLKAPEVVKISRPVRTGMHIRFAGEDVRKGEAVLQSGRIIRPQEMGFLSMLGISIVPVHRAPRIAIFSSGDELIPVEESLSPGKIHDANSYTLASLVEQYKGEVINLGIVPDNPASVRECLDRAVSEKVDLILSSAGVSVGALDFVREVIEQDGRLDFWRVNMRPGKPLAFGDYKSIPFIGLPGNPVSAYMGFMVFVRPALLKMHGYDNLAYPVTQVRLQEAITSDGRETYLRAVVSWQDGGLTARLTGHQGSGNLRSLVQANALLKIPPGVVSLPSGAQVDAWML
jgi:molybdopterin molybdotransferase